MKFLKKRKGRLVALGTLLIFLAGFVLSSLVLREEAKADSLLKFDEGYGSTVNDNSGNVSGTITGAVWKTEDLCFDGKCLYFDGTGDLINFGDDPDLDIAAADNVTLEGWFRTGDITSGQRTIIAKYNSATGTDGGYKVYMNSSGQIIFGIGNDNSTFPSDSVTTSTAYDDNRWHHFAAIKTGTTSISLHIDARLIGTDSSITSSTLENTDTFYIGIDGDGSSNGWSGFIDEVKVYRSTRTQAEINADFLKATPNRGTSVSFGPDPSYLSDGLVGYWKLDETSANTCSDSTGDSCDLSGNGSHGYWQDGTAAANGKFGNATSVDGTNDRLNLGNESGTDWPDLKRWHNRRKITFNNSSSSEDLNNFPMLIKLDSSRIDYSKTQNSGQDIRFYDSDGTALYYEIEKWDETGESLVWVKVPNIPAGSTTDYIWMYYNNSGAADAQSASNVWDSNFKMVQHMEETSGTTLADSTSNDLDLTKKAEAEPNANSSGKIDGTQSYDGTDDYAMASSYASLESNLTIEAWVNPTSSSTVFGIAGATDQCATTARGWKQYYFYIDTNAQLTYQISTTSTCGGGYNNDTYSTSSVTIPTGQWTHVAIKVLSNSSDSRTVTFYVNGTEYSGTRTNNGNEAGAFSHATYNNFVGSLSDQSGYYETANGLIDEVRISDTNRSNEWLESTINSHNDLYNAFGGEETVNFDLDTTWLSRKKITFDNSDSAEDLNNFPALIRLNSSRIDYSKTQNSGQDIRFYDSDGTELPYEIEKWDETGESLVWVKVPNIPAGSTTDYIWMYYNNSYVLDGQSANAVWNTNYKMVQHMEETSGTSMTDSTSNGYSPTKLSATEPNPTTSGKIDGAQSFDGTDDRGTLTDPADGGLDFGAADSFTVSTWINTSKSGFQSLVFKRRMAGGVHEEGYMLIVFSDNTIQFSIEDTNNAAVAINSTAIVNDGQWYHVVAVRDVSDDQLKLYINGSSAATPVTDTTTQTLQTTQSLYLGRYIDYTRWFQGTMDEVSISNVARSADWVEAEYKSMNDTLASFGSEVPMARHFGEFDDQMTVSAWVNATTLGATTRPIISKGASSSQDWYIQNSSANPGQLAFSSDGGVNTGLSTTTLSTGNWYLVTMSADNKKTRLFINGALDKEIDNAGYIENTGAVALGNYPNGGSGWLGSIDEARIYNRTLSPAEVSALYNWAPGPVAHWKLDENTGSSVNDSSGNDNNGSFSNGSWTEGKYGAGFLTKENDTTEEVTVTDPASGVLDFDETQDYTISIWLKWSSAETGFNYFRKGAGTLSDPGYTILINGTQRIDCRYYYGDGTNSETAILTGSGKMDGNWHNVTCVMDRDGKEVGGGTPGLYLFVDGILSASDTSLASATTSDNTNDLEFGDETTSREANGALDDIKIYNYARTPAQIIEDMNAGHPAPGSPVGSALLEYKLDKGYGDTGNNTGNGGSVNVNLAGATSCPGAAACPSWTNDGKLGKALSFDGTDDYAQTSSTVNFASNKITVAFWLYWNAFANDDDLAMELSSNFNNNNDTFLINPNTSSGFCTGGKMEFSIQSSPGSSAYRTECITRPSAATWHHYAVVFDNSTTTGDIKVYLDGREEATTIAINNKGGSGNFKTDTLYFMSRAGTSLFGAGKMDDVRIYTSELTADQVKLLYNQSSAAVWGATSTDSTGAATWSSTNEYCPPGQGSTCTPPIAEWRFDENTGTTANDTSGNANTGTLTNGVTFSPGKHGSGLYFPTTNNIVTAGSDTTIDNLFDGGATIEAWVKPTGSGGSDAGRVIDKEFWYLRKKSGAGSTVSFWFFSDFTTDGTWRTDSTYPTGIWTHIAVTYDNTSVDNDPTIYVNGVPVAITETSTPTGTRTDDNAQTLGVGGRAANPNQYEYDGYMDEVRIYDYVRTPAQITWDYNRGGPIGWWKFDECSGTTANDSSGNDNNGTITESGGGTNVGVGTCGGSSGTMWADGATGKRNASLDFDGTDDYVDLPDISSTNFITNNRDFSVSAWVKLPASVNPTRQRIVHRTESVTPENNWNLVWDDPSGRNALIFGTRENGSQNDAATVSNLSTGVWYHIVGVWDDSTGNADIYLNGILDSTSYGSALGGQTDGDFHIGTRDTTSGSTDHFQGQVDEVKIFNYALTDQQIRNEYNAGVVNFGY